MNTIRGLSFRLNAHSKKENPEILKARKTSILNVTVTAQIFKRVVTSLGVNNFKGKVRQTVMVSSITKIALRRDR